MAFNLLSVEKLKNIRVGRILIIGSTEVIINSDVGETKTAQHQLRLYLLVKMLENVAGWPARKD